MMYEKHFGLTSKPFASNVEGEAVFVGPQQAKVVTGLTRALAKPDAIVTVGGPVGVGKTTIVSRALESISPGRMVAWVGRMQLAPDEVLELLLTGFGISRQAKGTIQRFAAFRRLLNERARAGSQVAIVVEDALRIGVDALVELEALTATDSGDTSGANIILMGPPSLNELVKTPELARLSQRTRLRQAIEPFGPAEVQGYLRHCIRAAGGEFNSVFAGGAADIVHRCAEGIPRVINNICESALQAAAEAGAAPVTVDLVAKVAAEEFGIDTAAMPAPEPDAGPPATASAPPPADPAETYESADAFQDLSFEADATSRMQALQPEGLQESGLAADADATARAGEEDALAVHLETEQTSRIPALDPAQVEAAAAEAEQATDSTVIEDEAATEDAAAEFDLEPDDTQRMQAVDPLPVSEPAPDLPTLEPSAAAADATAATRETAVPVVDEPELPELQAVAEPPSDDPIFDDTTPSLEDLPMLSDSMRIDSPATHSADSGASPPTETVDVQAAAEPAEPVSAASADEAPVEEAKPPRKIPDIDALEAAIAAAHKGPTASDDAPAVQRPADSDPDCTVPGVPKLTLDKTLDKRGQKEDVPEDVVEGLSKAQSIEEIDDKMAETLFGDEDLDRIAAEVVANPPPDSQGPDADNPVAQGRVLEDDQPAPAKPRAGSSADPGPVPQGYTGEFAMSVTQRVAMVNSLKEKESQAVDGADTGGPEHIELSEERGTEPPPPRNGPDPEPIEEQIQTSITQTLKTLGDIRSSPAESNSEEEADSEEKGEEKRGLLGRFRNSS